MHWTQGTQGKGYEGYAPNPRNQTLMSPLPLAAQNQNKTMKRQKEKPKLPLTETGTKWTRLEPAETPVETVKPTRVDSNV